MSHSINESQLQLIAVQLGSIREDYTRKSFLERLAYRIQTEFVRKDARGKARFVRTMLGESFQRAGKWVEVASRRIHRPHCEHDGLWVAAACHGGLGDLVLYNAFLNSLYRECGFPTIHVWVHPLRLEEAKFVFHRSPAVKLLITEGDLNHDTTPYDVILRLGDLLSYEFVRTERVERISPEMARRLKTAREIQSPYRDFIQAQPSFDGLFASIAAQSGLRRLDVLGWLGNMPLTQDDPLYVSPRADAYQHLVDDLDLAHRPYITIHNGWDAVAHRHAEMVTKAWPERHYQRFVDLFHEKYPGVMVVQLGAKTSRPIPNVDLNLLNQTTLHQAAWVLKNSLLHVDGDSGLVHMARALHTRSVVLFGPTNHEFFRYRPNETLFSTNCRNCWWSQQYWMRSCPRGLAEPECMKSIDPATVLDVVARQFAAMPAWGWQLDDAREGPSPLPNADGDRAAQQHSWHAGYALDALQSAMASGQQLQAAVIDPVDSLARAIPVREVSPDIFAFQPESDAGESTPSRPDWDYGSVYNIPAEDETYDVVVAPVFTDRIAFPMFALKELRRILKSDGRLILAFDFASSTSDRGRGSVEGFREAIRHSGGKEPAASPSGAMVLRKKQLGLLAL